MNRTIILQLSFNWLESSMCANSFTDDIDEYLPNTDSENTSSGDNDNSYEMDANG